MLSLLRRTVHNRMGGCPRPLSHQDTTNLHATVGEQGGDYSISLLAVRFFSRLNNACHVSDQQLPIFAGSNVRP